MGLLPQELWYNVNSPNLRNLHIFGQLGYVPVMNPKIRRQKHKKRGLLAQYIRRDGDDHVFVELTDSHIRRFRGIDFHPLLSEGSGNYLRKGHKQRVDSPTLERLRR